MRVARFPIILAFVALALLPCRLLARQEKKKRVATQHAISHPNAHPEAQSKKRTAEAKKRLAGDRKQQKKAERAAKRVKGHPASLHPVQRSRAGSIAEGRGARTDPATASRVHAWVNAQETAHPAKPTDRKADLSAAQDKGDTGTANPPPDEPGAEQESQPDKTDPAKPVSVVSGFRRSADKPQLPPVEDIAAEPVILPALYTRRGRLVVPPPLKGSREILLRQNQVADDEGLDRIQNDTDLDRMRAAGSLIAIPSNAMLHVDDRLPANRRYCRPWTALFLDTLARQHYARFQSTLQLTSAVRTVEFQQQLIHRNGNAAPAEGDTASPHLTGQAIDIGKKGLSMAEIAWLRGYLLPLVQQGKVDVEEEFQQSCFHISVYKKYLPRAGAGRRSIATAPGNGLDVLATGLR